MPQFNITINRVSYASRNIMVNADDLESAKRTALEEAGDHEYREHDADYFVEIPPFVNAKREARIATSVGEVLVGLLDDEIENAEQQAQEQGLSVTESALYHLAVLSIDVLGGIDYNGNRYHSIKKFVEAFDLANVVVDVD
jgi:hypothetical protein